MYLRIFTDCLGYDMNKLSKNTQLAESPDTPLQKKKRSSDHGSLEVNKINLSFIGTELVVLLIQTGD